jgi:hypothetical protein
MIDFLQRRFHQNQIVNRYQYRVLTDNRLIFADQTMFLLYTRFHVDLIS